MSGVDPTLQDVLESLSFDLEDDPGAIARYLRVYPCFADEIIRFSIELRRPILDETLEIDAASANAIGAGLDRLRAARKIPAGSVLAGIAASRDLFEGRSNVVMKGVAEAVGVPRSVLIRIREGGIALATVPVGWARRLAAALNGTMDELFAGVGVSRVTAHAFKSDVRIEPPTQVSFETALREALVPEEEIAALLADDD